MMSSMFLLFVVGVGTEEEPVRVPSVECCLPSGCFQLEQAACLALVEEHRAYLNHEARARMLDSAPAARLKFDSCFGPRPSKWHPDAEKQGVMGCLKNV